MATVNEMWCEFEKAMLEDKNLDNNILVIARVVFAAGYGKGLMSCDIDDCNMEMLGESANYMANTIDKENKCS